MAPCFAAMSANSLKVSPQWKESVPSISKQRTKCFFINNIRSYFTICGIQMNITLPWGSTPNGILNNAIGKLTIYDVCGGGVGGKRACVRACECMCVCVFVCARACVHG